MARHRVTIQEALNKTYLLKLNTTRTGCFINFSPTLAGYRVGLTVIELPHVVRNNGDIIIANPEKLPNCQIEPIIEPSWNLYPLKSKKDKNLLKDGDGFEKLSEFIHKNKEHSP